MAAADEELVTNSFFGTPYEEIEESEAVSKKPTRIEEQVVTDENGRRRFHGAFTGGFSAGYFNTVGSKEGWTPATFVSSRADRDDLGKKKQRPEDYMDAEDLGQFGIAPRRIAASKDFTAEDQSSIAKEDRKRRLAWDHKELAEEADALAELIKPVHLSIGAQILQKMGWRPGKGIGPKMSRKSKTKIELMEENAAEKSALREEREEKEYGCILPPEEEQFISEMASGFEFAPEDVDAVFFEHKADRKGLGYQGLLSDIFGTEASTKPTALKVGKGALKGIRGQAFGVGAFEDDDYAAEDISRYDYTLGPQPALSSKTGMISDDFAIAAKPQLPRKFYPPPRMPPNWAPNHEKIEENVETSKKSKERPNPVQRAEMLGEKFSVFSLLKPEDRNRLEAIKEGKPQTSGSRSDSKNSGSRFESKKDEKPPNSSFGTRKDEKSYPSRNSGPAFIKAEAKDEKPATFPNDFRKETRFQDYCAYARRGLVMPKPLALTDWEWESELAEFEKSLPQDFEKFKPSDVGKPLATKLDPGLTLPFAARLQSKFRRAGIEDSRLDVEQKKSDEDERLTAIQMKMFGAMTRQKYEWHPSTLLCRRMNIPNPYPDSVDVGVPSMLRKHRRNRDDEHFDQLLLTGQELQLRRQKAEAEVQPEVKTEPETSEISVPVIKTEPEVVGIEETEAEIDEPEAEMEVLPPSVPEKPRPPMDLFKAIFADSDEEASADGESSSSEAETGPEIKKKLPPEIAAIDFFSSPAISELKLENLVGKQAETSDVFGPSLPPEIADLGGPSLPFDSVISRNRESSKNRKKKRHKKEKKHRSKSKKKKSREKEKEKNKKKRSKRESDSGSEKSSDSSIILD